MKNDTSCFPVALTIAGSDSGGGAGIQADLRAFRCAGVFGCSAIAAVTSQNPAEVRHIEPLSPHALRTQIEAVADTLQICAVKTGMLFSSELIRTVKECCPEWKNVPLVVDPVMVSTSGSRLLQMDAVETSRSLLLPEADWITPNIPEAELLLDRKLHGFPELLSAAAELAETYQSGIILKGGHAEDDPMARDAVCLPDGTKMILSSPRLDTLPHASHGTGCTFSSSLAAWLAKGCSAEQALLFAKTFVYESLRQAKRISREDGFLVGAMPPDLRISEVSEGITLEKA